MKRRVAVSSTAGSVHRKLWLIVPTFHPVIGGEQTQVKELAKAYIACGWPVHVLTRRHDIAHQNGLAESAMVEGIPVSRVYSRGGKFGWVTYMVSAFWRLLRHGRGAIYHAHDIGAAGWLAVIAANLLGGRSIVKLRSGRRGLEERLSSPLARWQFSGLLHLADRIVVVNSEVEVMVKQMGIPEWRVSRIPNGVDAGHFYPASSGEKVATRQRLGLPTDKAIILSVGRLVPVKGLDILLQAWALLPEHLRSRALLLLVGDGPQRETLIGKTQMFGVQESVLLAGDQKAVRDYYWAADVFVLPSRSEGLSVSLIEAMACELPVVVSRVGGAIDLVDADDNGVLFKSGDHFELAQKIATMLQASDGWPKKAARARQTVMAYADMNTVVEQFVKLYDELA